MDTIYPPIFGKREKFFSYPFYDYTTFTSNRIIRRVVGKVVSFGSFNRTPIGVQLMHAAKEPSRIIKVIMSSDNRVITGEIYYKYGGTPRYNYYVGGVYARFEFNSTDSGLRPQYDELAKIVRKM